MTALIAASLGTLAAAFPAPAVSARLEVTPQHSYTSQNRAQTFTFVVHNGGRAPATLTCRSAGAPILRGFDGSGTQTRLIPVGNAPICQRAGQILTLPGLGTWNYAKEIRPLPAGQYTPRAGWNVSVQPGESWLTGSAVVVVVAGSPPVPTPNPKAYLDALKASRAKVYAVGTGGLRVKIDLADDTSRDAYLRELKKRGLDASKVDIDVMSPVRFGPARAWPHTATLNAVQSGGQYKFTLSVTNRSDKVLTGMTGICHPLIVERVSDGRSVWQSGDMPCPDLGVGVNLKPGDTHTEPFTWDGKNSLGDPVPAGRYRVRAGWFGFSEETIITVR